MRIVPLVLALATLATPAFAADHEVRMLLNGAGGPTVFEPALTHVAVGDTVTFIPTAAMHSVETVPGMLPAGATPFKGELNQPLTVTFDQPGTYGIECQKHFIIGMVALVVVGDEAADADTVKVAKLPFRARERFEEMLEAQTA
jgi:pseudoazurin